MNLAELIERTVPPVPWSEGENIPWHEAEFSRRMLHEHLSQDHDAASRRAEKIDRHVRWIHQELLSSRPTRILDLCCGPGLYTSRLARLGHECVGIDYSPAAIAYASDQAERESLRCTYRRQDVRRADYGQAFGLAMLIFGELNVFAPADAASILGMACEALDDSGLLLLEPHTFAAVEKIGSAAPSWYSAKAGLFSDRPHVCLQENFWDEQARAATTRYFIVSLADGQVSRHAASYQAYTDAEYRSMLHDCGFGGVRACPSLGGDEDDAQEGLMVIVATRLPRPVT